MGSFDVTGYSCLVNQWAYTQSRVSTWYVCSACGSSFIFGIITGSLNKWLTAHSNVIMKKKKEEEEVYLQISVSQYRLMWTYKYNITQNKWHNDN